MIRYSDEIIEEVRQNNDIVDIISQYVHLTRKGRNYFGLCPFHIVTPFCAQQEGFFACYVFVSSFFDVRLHLEGAL